MSETKSRVNYGNVKKWAKALRSGKYSQTTGCLYRPETSDRGTASFCCLGVLEHEICGIPVKNLRAEGVLLETGAMALGITGRDVKICGRYASVLNDDDNLSFDEIADLLEIACIEKGDSIV